MREGLENLYEMKTDLFEEMLKTASKNISPPWTRKQLIKVLSSFKKGKARDPHGFVYELFRPDVAGDNLIDGLVLILNEIKKQQKVPKAFN